MITAARYGKHVLCEKPLALNAAEVEAIIQAARQYQVIVMEGFMYRYTERIKKLQEILAAGVIGEIKYIQSTFRFFLDRPNTIKVRAELGGGSLYDVGCYPVEFAGLVTGMAPVSVAAEADFENGVDHIFSGVLRYPGGIIASINSGFIAFPRNYSEITGTKGRIEVPDTFLGNAGTIRVITVTGTNELTVAESDHYSLEIADFNSAVVESGQPRISLTESLRNLRVIESLFQSLQRKKPG